jgi:N-acetylglucosaminyl-diphospho-decaprenol L-rhamnosyltransferase
MNTTIIIVAYRSEKIIEKNLNKLDPNCKIIIVDNSHNENFKSYIEKKYKKVSVVLNNNEGFGQAANLGVKLANTKYIFFCSPDNFIGSQTVYQLEQIADKYNNFGLLILTEKKSKLDHIIKVDKEIGMSSFFSKRSDFIKLSGFDENFFLYYEDVDLVKRYLSNNFIVYKVPIKYENKHGSHDAFYNQEIEINRNWHFMWSKFYFKRKHYNYMLSFFVNLPYLLRSILKIILNFKNPEKKNKYKARFSGLLNGYQSRPSWYRPRVK